MPPPPPPKKNVNVNVKPTSSQPTTTSFSSSPVVERSEVKGSGKPKIPGSRQIGQDQIAKRAYEIYAGRGYAQGDPNADWLEAERQLKAGL